MLYFLSILATPLFLLKKFVYLDLFLSQDARASFRQTLSDTTHKLDTMARKLGSCVEKARPYYDARYRAKEVGPQGSHYM